MFWRRVRYEEEPRAVRTVGLTRRGHPELRVDVRDPALRGAAKDMLAFVVEYIRRSGREIRASETLRYGYWLVKFLAAEGESGTLEVWELDANASDFVLGASLTLGYWREQHRVCRRYNAVFSPPEPESMTALSAGVMEGQPAHALRYPWPAHMSGWVIVTDAYDGDVRSLVNQHTYHLTSARPDLAPYVALPPGFGFDLRDGIRVTYDEAALREHLLEYFGSEAVEAAGFPKPKG